MPCAQLGACFELQAHNAASQPSDSAAKQDDEDAQLEAERQRALANVPSFLGGGGRGGGRPAFGGGTKFADGVPAQGRRGKWASTQAGSLPSFRPDQQALDKREARFGASSGASAEGGAEATLALPAPVQTSGKSCTIDASEPKRPNGAGGVCLHALALCV